MPIAPDWLDAHSSQLHELFQQSLISSRYAIHKEMYWTFYFCSFWRDVPLFCRVFLCKLWNITDIVWKLQLVEEK